MKKSEAEKEKKYKIIIVDDDEYLVNMYATKFSLNNAMVESCKSGDALLEKLRGGATADLILLDIIMPGSSGLEVLGKMWEEKLCQNIPVVMLTNQSDEKDISRAQKFGVAGYIVKAAATPSEVVSEVIKIIESK